jgi:UDP-N-acetylglucosamine 2-epimerase (non-hydrolysing)
MKTVLCVVGTRPEVIKMAPVIMSLKTSGWANVKVLATAQHRDLLDQALNFFGIEPDIDLNLMSPNQSLADLTAKLLQRAHEVLNAERPDIVLVQGDTTTVMAMALACFYLKIPVGHIEAGLRTLDIRNPFPEEANRVIVGKLADLHFAPTESSKRHLLAEQVKDAQIFVTGNTVIDALFWATKKGQATNSVAVGDESSTKMVLITAHRRENFGVPFERICQALRTLAIGNPNVKFLYAVHPNPNVRTVAHEILSELTNVELSAPLDYPQFVAAMQKAHFIISDSGGVQEEAPALGKPVLVLRTETERPEAVDAGVVKLVGTDSRIIVQEAQKLLDDSTTYQAMARGISPYGDGHAAVRILAALKEYLKA